MPFETPPIDESLLQQLESPSLLILEKLVRQNIERMIEVAGSADRLRPHCKTHKMEAVVRLLLQYGIRQHKAATIAEAEMLAAAGVRDIVLAYNPVGPNIGRTVQLAQSYPEAKFCVTADHPTPIQQLSEAAAAASVTIGVMLDLDVGLQRTGVDPDTETSLSLYRQLSVSENLVPAGFHIYDGHQHQHSLAERRAAVLAEWPRVQRLKSRCEADGLKVPELLCGGTPTFPVYAELDDPEIRLSPGTSVFHDAGYGGNFPDLGFTPAAVVVTRVISRPAADRVTLDLGNKAVAADPPRGQRVYFPDLPDAAQVIHNEEHLVLQTPMAERYQPGDVLLGIPAHICPTSALHRDAAVITADGQLDRWTVSARDRRLTV